ncbi:hypothetical protein C8R47DRAFT_1329973 [Mycena vitilis]|nr:hypothetical protein C8R47DRAFT_1329973 [Mycena vitilis]
MGSIPCFASFPQRCSWCTDALDAHRTGSHLRRVGGNFQTLPRSRGCKIWAKLRESSWDREIVPHNLIAERLGHLAPHTNRIQRLGLSNEESVDAMLAPFRDAPVRCLEHLEFRVATGCDKCIRPANMFLSGAHSLNFLKLENCAPYFPVPDWMMSLTHLELWYCDLGMLDDDGNTYRHLPYGSSPLYRR